MYFTLDDIGDGGSFADSTDGYFLITVDRPFPGRVVLAADHVGTVVGIDRVKEWVVYALNMLVEDVGRPKVEAILVEPDGLRIRSPVSAGELDDWDRLDRT